LLLWLHVER
jgi:hypothetical protein